MRLLITSTLLSSPFPYPRFNEVISEVLTKYLSKAFLSYDLILICFHLCALSFLFHIFISRICCFWDILSSRSLFKTTLVASRFNDYPITVQGCVLYEKHGIFLFFIGLMDETRASLVGKKADQITNIQKLTKQNKQKEKEKKAGGGVSR